MHTHKHTCIRKQYKNLHNQAQSDPHTNIYKTYKNLFTHTNEKHSYTHIQHQQPHTFAARNQHKKAQLKNEAQSHTQTHNNPLSTFV